MAATDPAQPAEAATVVLGPADVRGAEVVVPCDDLGSTLEFFTTMLGFRLEAIFPADAPAVAVMSGGGLRLRLDRHAAGGPGNLRLRLPGERLLQLGGATTGALVLHAPNGTRVELVDDDPPMVVPVLVPSFHLSRSADGAVGVGRAGMQYRDLVPDRQGGRFIASHIRIPDGGPVPDYVHFHKVRFQLIFCVAGWVEVVYEDQGEPFVLRAGDCVLQPPQIRHRVLRSSAGLEVVEISCPAEHETLVDDALELPTARHDPERDFGGQRFVRHVAAAARWRPSKVLGFDEREVGALDATAGLAAVRVLRPAHGLAPLTAHAAAPVEALTVHAGELRFWFVLAGRAILQRTGAGPEELRAGDSVVVPAGLGHGLAGPSADLELLEVTLPGELPVTAAAVGTGDDTARGEAR